MLRSCSNLLHVGVEHILGTQLFLQLLRQLGQGQRQDESRVCRVLKANKKTSSRKKYISHQNRICHIIKQTVIMILKIKCIFKKSADCVNVSKLIVF